jgi:HK97 family phage portal protein
MNLLQKAVFRIARAIGLTDPRLYRALGVTDAYTGETVTATSALALSATWACVNLVAGTIGSLPVMVYRTVNGNREPATDHLLYRLLHDTPNADQTALEYWEFIAASLELEGNAYSEIMLAGGGRITSLAPPIPPSLMTVRKADSGRLVYSWVEDGEQREVDERRMLHIRGFGGSVLGGLSTLAMARQTMGLAQAIERTAGSTFANGIRSSGVLHVKNQLKIEQRQEVERRLLEKYTGAVKAGVPMVLDNDMRWETLSINPNDAQMLESRGFSVEEICRFFGVPPVMIGHTSKMTSWPTGVEQQGLILQKFTFRRRVKRIEQAVMKKLLTPADRAKGVTVEFNMEGILRGDSAARSAFYTAGLQNGWLTINEVRRLENLPPVPGGDVPRMQMQNVPITDTPAMGHNGGPKLDDEEDEE